MAGRAVERSGAVASLTVAGVNDPSAQRAVDQIADAVQQAQEDIRKIRGDGFGPGRLIGRQIFTASGTYTPTVGTRRVRVSMVGGGGGGGGAAGGANRSAGAGGGSGVFWEKAILEATGITGGAVTIGAAGAAGTSAGGTGGTGGDTSVVVQGVTYTAKGGTGGVGTVSGVGSAALGGRPQSGSTAGADYTGGESGEMAIVVDAAAVQIGGAGGSGLLGIGGASAGAGNTVGAGSAGTGFGAGGGGANAQAAGFAGGVGAAGAVIIEEYT